MTVELSISTKSPISRAEMMVVGFESQLIGMAPEYVPHQKQKTEINKRGLVKARL